MREAVRYWMVAALVLGLGCVSKSRYGALEERLGECSQDKLAAQEAAQLCEERYAREIERWDDIQTVVEEALPQAIREFEAERDSILQLIPAEIQQEVESYLTNFARAVAKSFDTLHEQNERILTQLEVYKATLEEVGVRTRSIDDTVTQKLQDAAEGRKQVAGVAAEIIDEIQGFDRSYISDKASRERLKLNRNQRETIALFHDGLVRRLVELRDALGEG
ncbi:MAG: hypothetical protein V3R89_09570 [Thermoanaerobaculia bacterium]